MVGIIPIFVSAGGTVLPALVSATATALACALRPFDGNLAKKGRRLVFLMAICALLAAIGGIHYWHQRSKLRRVAAPEIDWAEVARDLLQREAASSARLRPIWSFKQANSAFLSSPILVDDRVFATATLVDVGGTYGTIYCLDGGTGREIWHVDHLNGVDLHGIFSSPVVSEDGKSLVIGEGLHFDEDCHLICLETATGKLRWKIDVPKNHVEGTPAIHGDMVVAGAGAIEHGTHPPNTARGYVFAVRIPDGQLMWQRNVDDPESSPAIAEDAVAYIGSGVGGNAIVALNTRDVVGPNRLLWRTSTRYPATGDATLDGNCLFVGTGRGDYVNADREPAGEVLALDRYTGATIWRREVGDAVLGRIAVQDGRVICPLRSGLVVALSTLDGSPVWSAKVSASPVLAGVTIAAEKVYAVSSDGFLHVLDARDGRGLEKHFLNDENAPGQQNLSISSPFVANGRLFVGSETGGLKCFTDTTR